MTLLKKQLVTLCLLCISVVSYSQDYKTEIKTQFNDYLDAITSMDFNKSMDYVSEDLFKIIPRDQMVRVMEQTFNTPGIEFKLEDAKIHEVNDAEKIEGKFYAMLQYSNVMFMKINTEDDENEEETEEEKAESQELQLSLTKMALQQTFVENNVKYDEKTQFFEIYAEKQAYAISPNGKDNWKFIVVEKNQKAFLERLLPKVLTDKI